MDKGGSQSKGDSASTRHHFCAIYRGLHAWWMEDLARAAGEALIVCQPQSRTYAQFDSHRIAERSDQPYTKVAGDAALRGDWKSGALMHGGLTSTLAHLTGIPSLSLPRCSKRG